MPISTAFLPQRRVARRSLHMDFSSRQKMASSRLCVIPLRKDVLTALAAAADMFARPRGARQPTFGTPSRVLSSSSEANLAARLCFAGGRFRRRS